MKDLPPEIEESLPKELQLIRKFYLSLPESERKEIDDRINCKSEKPVLKQEKTKSTKFCFECGKTINRDAKFCEYCGIKQLA